MKVSKYVQLPQVNPSIFWGEIAPPDHLVQFYEDDAAVLDSLEGFVAGGLQTGDSVVLIVTPQHMAAIEKRLRKRGVNLTRARARDQYIALDAEETLAKFMVNGWPDDQLFQALVTDLLGRARKGGRRVRAFGEMVAILWARGDNAATVRLEHLWQKLCKSELFCLFCAYPKSGFTQNSAESIRHICDEHSKLVAA